LVLASTRCRRWYAGLSHCVLNLIALTPPVGPAAARPHSAQHPCGVDGIPIADTPATLTPQPSPSRGCANAPAPPPPVATAPDHWPRWQVRAKERGA
jgi:hypothetical protein